MGASIETERKFLIYMPCIKELETMPDYTFSKITQIYIESSAGVTHRTRKRVFSDRCEYTQTIKKRISKSSSYETECELTEDEYLALSAKIAIGTKPILKHRHTFFFEGHTVEIDVYPQWTRCAVMELELSLENEEIKLPEFINVKEELTGRKEYSNAAMSRFFPPEPI